MFDTVDRNNDGYITPEEWRIAFDKLDEIVHPNDIEKMEKLVNKDYSGRITWDEVFYNFYFYFYFYFLYFY